MGTQAIIKEKVSINTARLKKDGTVFEVALDPDLAISFKKGEEVAIADILKSDKIFFDVNRGMLASESEMKRVFKTDDTLVVAEAIIRNGDIQLTSEYRQQLRDEKRRRIIQMIHMNGMDPRTKLPHPITRIENALSEAKVHFDEFLAPEDQLDDVIKKIRPILPISLKKVVLQVHIPSASSAKCYSALSSYKKIRDEWQNDGSWTGTLEVPAGLLEDLYSKLNSMTHGGVDIKELE